jgi:phosphate transport system substrate-binding protein
MRLLKILILCIILISGCSYKPPDAVKVRIKGSDTMLIVTELLAEHYMKEHPGVSVYVEGGGTALGVKSLSTGEIDICTASRPLKAEEVKILSEKFGLLGMSTIIAKDGLTIFVHPENPVDDISLEQLKDIFTCRISNWKYLGGKDTSIVPVSRNPNSGTYLYFKDHILEGEEYCDDITIEPTTQSIIQKITENKNAIGYGGIGYYTSKVKHLKINGEEPTEKNVIDNIYPISRYLYLYTLQTPEGPVKNFIDWVLSPEGQKVIKEAGYIPLWEIAQ